MVIQRLASVQKWTFPFFSILGTRDLDSDFPVELLHIYICTFTLIPNNGLKRALENDSLSRSKHFNNNVGQRQLYLCYQCYMLYIYARLSILNQESSFILSTIDASFDPMNLLSVVALDESLSCCVKIFNWKPGFLLIMQLTLILDFALQVFTNKKWFHSAPSAAQTLKYWQHLILFPAQSRHNY